MRTALLVILVALAGAAGAQQDRSLSAEQSARYHALIDELRCVICQNQSIAESNAPLAKDMRKLVKRRILEGRSDAEIKNFLVARYGEWVLYRPPFQPRTWALWLGPAALLLVALAAALILWRRAAARPDPPPPDRESIARLVEGKRGKNS